MILKSAKPKTPFTFLRSLFIVPAIASVAMMVWCVWQMFPYFLMMAICGFIFQLSIFGMAPLFRNNWFARVKL